MMKLVHIKFTNWFNQLPIHFAGLVHSKFSGKNAKTTKFIAFLNLCMLRDVFQLFHARTAHWETVSECSYKLVPPIF